MDWESPHENLLEYLNVLESHQYLFGAHLKKRFFLLLLYTS